MDEVAICFIFHRDESETCLCKREREYHTNRVETRKGTWSKETNTDYVKSENGLLKTGAPVRKILEIHGFRNTYLKFLFSLFTLT